MIMKQLDANDLCDQCTAGYKVTVYHSVRPGMVLRFCRHHYAEQETALLTKGWQVIIHASEDEVLASLAATIG
jgi:hypothetical protein